MDKELTCEHCGYTGQGVVPQVVRLYADKYETRNYCEDIKSCWTMWEEKRRDINSMRVK